MATVNTIGTTGRDYSTIQAWEDAIPATPTGGYEGHCYNDSLFSVAGTPLTVAGHTTSATDYIKLTAAAGQSFQDHANVRTNPLIWDQAMGVAVTCTGASTQALNIDDSFFICERIQFRKTTHTYSQSVVDNDATTTDNVYKDCIFAKTFSGTQTIAAIRVGTIINCLIYDSGATATNGALFLGLGAGMAMNCTVVRVGATGGTGFNSSAATNYLKNCAVFGWTTAFAGTTPTASDTGYNATDAASAPGSNNQVSKTFADQFVSTTADFRLKTGADCINTGNTSEYALNDISATVRGSGTAGDIGAWEFVSAAVPAPMMGRRVYILP